jgi:two-component system sensor histidine kinase ArlS
MKIRTRLTILFTVITATILLAFASVIYFSAKKNREKEFYSILKKEAITKANLFFNAKVDAQTLQDIYRNNREILNEVEVAIYDTGFNLLYHDAVDIDYVKETPEMINEIFQKGEIQFYQQDWQVIGLRYEYKNKNYIITATAIDQYGYNKLNSLLKNSIVVFIISIIFIYIAGLYFSKKAFDPVKDMIEKAKVISATNLDLRLNSNGSKDELAELANTFNEMLNRLENSFDAQKHFVSNISHELRTPLAAIITELELSTNKEKSVAEYKSTINLFENGCKFSKDKQSSVSISFERDKIQLRFTDKGIGISENDLKYIFTPFYRGENKIYAEGNGIGLALTKNIILLHKGTISVSSKQNEGTTFYVELLHI